MKSFSKGYYFLCLLLSYHLSWGQASEQSYELYEPGFEFTDGIYTSFAEFKANQPQIKYPIKKIGNMVYYQVTEDSIVEISSDNAWGYSLLGNVYIARNGQFWKCINIGQLIQFTAIENYTYRTIDTYGFYNEYQAQNLQKSFLDMESGAIKEMNYENLKPYIEREPRLANYIKRKRNAKYGELVQVLKGYNKLNPIYFPTNE